MQHVPFGSVGRDRGQDEVRVDEGTDLPTATPREADWIVGYVRKEVQLNDKDHKKASKATDEELAALVAWLNEQPAAAK